MIKDPELRKLAGLPSDVSSLLREEQHDVSSSDLLQFLEMCLRGQIQEKADVLSADGLAACAALEAKGYSAKEVATFRSYFALVKEMADAKQEAAEALKGLRTQRWDKKEVY